MPWKNTTPCHRPLYTTVSSHFCFKQKSRYNNQGNILDMDLSLWFSWQIPHRQWRRVCKQQFYIVMWKFCNKNTNNSCWIILEQWTSRVPQSYSTRHATVMLTLLLRGPSMLKTVSVTSTDFHLINHQLAPTQIK